MVIGRSPGYGQSHLQGPERGTGVAVGHRHQGGHGVLVGLGLLGLEATPHDLGDVVVVEGLEAPQRRPAQQGRVDREEGILGGGADQDDQPVLHRGQQGVLLATVEAVDLVDEEDGAPTVLAERRRASSMACAHVGHPGADRRQRARTPWP